MARTIQQAAKFVASSKNDLGLLSTKDGRFYKIYKDENNWVEVTISPEHDYIRSQCLKGKEKIIQLPLSNDFNVNNLLLHYVVQCVDDDKPIDPNPSFSMIANIYENSPRNPFRSSQTTGDLFDLIKDLCDDEPDDDDNIDETDEEDDDDDCRDCSSCELKDICGVIFGSQSDDSTEESKFDRGAFVFLDGIFMGLRNRILEQNLDNITAYICYNIESVYPTFHVRSSDSSLIAGYDPEERRICISMFHEEYRSYNIWLDEDFTNKCRDRVINKMTMLINPIIDTDIKKQETKK